MIASYSALARVCSFRVAERAGAANSANSANSVSLGEARRGVPSANEAAQRRSPESSPQRQRQRQAPKATAIGAEIIEIDLILRAPCAEPHVCSSC